MASIRCDLWSERCPRARVEPMLRVLETCAARARPPPPKASLEATVEMKKNLRPGETVELTLRMTNRTTDPLVLDLDLPTSCPDILFSIVTYDEKGGRADHEYGPGCGVNALRSCGGRVIRIELAAGGSITKKRRYAALVTKEAEGQFGCSEWQDSLKPGKYRLDVRLPFEEPFDRAHPEAALERFASATFVVR